MVYEFYLNYQINRKRKVEFTNIHETKNKLLFILHHTNLNGNV